MKITTEVTVPAKNFLFFSSDNETTLETSKNGALDKRSSEWIMKHSDRSNFRRVLLSDDELKNTGIYKIRLKKSKKVRNLSVKKYFFDHRKEETATSTHEGLMLVKSLENTQTDYLLKEPDDFQYEGFIAPKVLEFIKYEKGFLSLEATHQWILENYYLDDYQAKKEIFCAAVVLIFNNLILNNNVGIKYNLFDINNIPYVGSAYNKAYKDWYYLYNNNKIDGYEINEQGFIVVPTTTQPLLFRIKGLAIAALVRLILGVADLHHKNWGLEKREDYFQAILLDFGQCLLNFETEIITPSVLMNLIESTFNAISKIEYDLEEYDIPKEIANAQYVQDEFNEAIYFLEHSSSFNNVMEIITDLANQILFNYPYHSQLHIERIESSIRQIIDSAQHLETYKQYKKNREEAEYNETKEKYLNSSPGYALSPN